MKCRVFAALPVVAVLVVTSCTNSGVTCGRQTCSGGQLCIQEAGRCSTCVTDAATCPDGFVPANSVLWCSAGGGCVWPIPAPVCAEKIPADCNPIGGGAYNGQVSCAPPTCPT